MAAFIIFCLFGLAIYSVYYLAPPISLVLAISYAVIALHVLVVSERRK